MSAEACARPAFLPLQEVGVLCSCLAELGFITDDEFYARCLQSDDKQFYLDSFIRDLGNASTFTISKLDSTVENLNQFAEPLKRGTELFGPSQTTHP